MDVSNASRETVIIVHGTWGNARKGANAWYEPLGSSTGEVNFVEKLNAALERRKSPARCWAHCNASDDIFRWSGANSWLDRADAATELKAYVDALVADNWACHIVAHSHGGNIVNDAFPETSGRISTIVTLGTPFIEVMEVLDRRRAFWRRILNVLFGLIAVAFSLFSIFVIFSDMPKGDESGVSLFIYIFAAPVLFSCWLAATRYLQYQKKQEKHKKSNNSKVRKLAINSSLDEAWQLLYHLRNASNPFLPKSGFFGHVIGKARESRARLIKNSRVRGGRSFGDLSFLQRIYYIYCVIILLVCFYVFFVVLITTLRMYWELIIFGCAMLIFALFNVALGALAIGTAFWLAILAPLRWAIRWLKVGFAWCFGMVNYLMRHQAWVFMRNLALGLDMYPYKAPPVCRIPENNGFVPGALPNSVALRTLTKRNHLISGHLGTISETLSALVLSSADVESMLRIFESDLSLVHASYYQDQECIDQIADWIVDAHHEQRPPQDAHVASEASR